VDTDERPKRYRFIRPGLLVLALLLAATGTGLAVWFLVLPVSWTADYDKEMYKQISEAIAADKDHLRGKSFEEVSTQLDLKDVPWDEAGSQGGQLRVYHFRGFAFYVLLDRDAPDYKPSRNGKPLNIDVVRIALTKVWIDGLGRQERMRRIWKSDEEECERINARMKRH